MELEDITLKYVDGENKDFVMLCDELDQALDDMVGTHVQRAEYVQYNQRDSILETGAPLKAAQHLYTKLGYKVIPNYGQYANMTSSICMKKTLR